MPYFTRRYTSFRSPTLTTRTRRNLIDHAVVLPRPDINAVEFLFRFHLLRPMRTRTLFEAENVPVDLLSDVGIELAKVPFSGGSDFNAVGQESVSKFPHEVAKRNGSLLFRLFQGGAGVFEIDSVHFLPGQALQEVEVIHRNHGGQVFPATAHNGPLLPVGGAVYDFGKLLPHFRDAKACHGDVPFVRFVRVNYQYGAGVTAIASGRITESSVGMGLRPDRLSGRLRGVGPRPALMGLASGTNALS